MHRKHSSPFRDQDGPDSHDILSISTMVGTPPTPICRLYMQALLNNHTNAKDTANLMCLCTATTESVLQDHAAPRFTSTRIPSLYNASRINPTANTAGTILTWSDLLQLVHGHTQLPQPWNKVNNDSDSIDTARRLSGRRRWIGRDG